MPLVSIIVPVYNVEKYISNCIDSILKQTLDDFELILIIDGSKDQSAEICENYIRNDERIKIFYQENKGVSAARNQGINIARGEFIYFCDADDELSPSLLKANYEVARRNDANLVVFGFNNVLEKEIISSVAPTSSKFLKTNMEFIDYFPKLHQSYLTYTVWNKLYDRSFLISNKMYFEKGARIGEDAIFNYNLFRDIERVYVNSGTYYNYTIHRKDSALNSYNPNIYELRNGEVESLEDLFGYWNKRDDYLSFICIEKVKNLNIYYYSVFCRSDVGSYKKKLSKLQSIIRKNMFAINFLQKDKSISIKQRLKLKLFQLNSNLLFALMYSIKRIKERPRGRL
jgi:glycosyltransferase involved in cell wall biosynthesis